MISFQLVGIHNIDLDAPPAANATEDSNTTTFPVEPLDPEEEQRQLTARTEAWRSLQLDFNAKQQQFEWVLGQEIN